jgi:hypothetical protein
MDTIDRIAVALKTRFSSDPALGDFDVDVRTSYDHMDPDDKSSAGFTFIVKNPVIETDPAKAEQHLLAQLASIEALQPYLKTESKKSHMKRMADELSAFIELEAELNAKDTGSRAVSIPPEYAKWFEELPKRNDWSTKHALNITKTNLGVIQIAISIPKDADINTVVANFESRKDAIKEMLANRVVKYTPGLDTKEKKENLAAQVKDLEIIITPSSNDVGQIASIQIMSKKQKDEIKAAGSGVPDNIPDLLASNPLMALKDGEDDKNPENPAHLKKALARSFLFAGEKANDIFPLVAGKDDMRRAIAKSLVHLKNRQPENTELAKKIDAFLGDDVFKDPDRWGTPVEERKDFKEAPRFLKMGREIGSKPYTKGEMAIELTVPADKFTKIRDQLAALAEMPQAQQTAETPSPTNDKLAVAGETATTALGAAEKTPVIDPAAIAAAEVAKRKPPEGPAAAAR